MLWKIEALVTWGCKSAAGMSMLKKLGFKPEYGLAPKVFDMFDSMSVGVAFLPDRLPANGAVVRFYWLRVLLGAVNPAMSTDRLLRCCQETLAV